jgi:hypothetical protein
MPQLETLRAPGYTETYSVVRCTVTFSRRGRTPSETWQ